MKPCIACGTEFYVSAFHDTGMPYEKKYCTKVCYEGHRKSTEYQAAKFWARVDKSGSCWIYTGAVESNGYGYPSWRKGHKLAHRLAYELVKGPIPKGMLVCHTCDTPPCCNPEHLFLGTKQTNKEDSMAKRRHAVGEQVKRNKLTTPQVIAIRREYRKDGEHRGAASNARELADAHGVDVGAIHAIVARRTWKHVT